MIWCPIFRSLVSLVRFQSAPRAWKTNSRPLPPIRFSSLPLELVHSDLHGPLPATANGFKYWISFTDDASRYRRCWLLHKKSEAFDAFKHYKAWAEKQTGKSLKSFRDDKGGEYMSNEWERFMLEHGIERQHTVRATPQQNGVAERTNRILDEGVASLLSDSHFPARFWGEALSCYLHTLNLSPQGGWSPILLFFSVRLLLNHDKNTSSNPHFLLLLYIQNILVKSIQFGWCFYSIPYNEKM